MCLCAASGDRGLATPPSPKSGNDPTFACVHRRLRPPSPSEPTVACAHRRLRPHRRLCPPSPVIACAAVAWTAVSCARTIRARPFFLLVGVCFVGGYGRGAPCSCQRVALLGPAQRALFFSASWVPFGPRWLRACPCPPDLRFSPLAPGFCGSLWRLPRLRLPPAGVWRPLGYQRQLASVRAFFLRLGALRGRLSRTPPVHPAAAARAADVDGSRAGGQRLPPAGTAGCRCRLRSGSWGRRFPTKGRLPLRPATAMTRMKRVDKTARRREQRRRERQRVAQWVVAVAPHLDHCQCQSCCPPPPPRPLQQGARGGQPRPGFIRPSPTRRTGGQPPDRQPPVTAGHPAPTLGEPVPPSQRGTRGFASGAIGSSQSETVTGSREGNMSY